MPIPVDLQFSVDKTTGEVTFVLKTSILNGWLAIG
jgi:hypothetical protein